MGQVEQPVEPGDLLGEVAGVAEQLEVAAPAEPVQEAVAVEAGGVGVEVEGGQSQVDH